MKINKILSYIFVGIFSLIFQSSIYAAVSVKTHEMQILTWLTILDKNEIKLGQLALKNSSNSNVKNFAKTMITHHGQNLQEATHLLKKNRSPMAMTSGSYALKKKGMIEFNAIKSLKGEEFDRSYITLMVNGHKEALQMMDKNLVASSHYTPDIKSFFQATRDTIQEHLKAALSLQRG